MAPAHTSAVAPSVVRPSPRGSLFRRFVRSLAASRMRAARAELRRRRIKVGETPLIDRR